MSSLQVSPTLSSILNSFTPYAANLQRTIKSITSLIWHHFEREKYAYFFNIIANKVREERLKNDYILHTIILR